MPAPSGFDHVSKTSQIAHAASPPNLAKIARMGHPQAECCTQRIVKGGPSAICTELPTYAGGPRMREVHLAVGAKGGGG
jgi:hypothetical protein